VCRAAAKGDGAVNCSRDLIEAWLDEELDAGGAAAVARHVEDCAACAEISARLREQKGRIRAEAPYYRAPADLRESIRSALRRADTMGREKYWRAVAIAACVLLALSIAWNVLRTHTVAPQLAESVLDDHIRSLIGGHTVEVPSSDRHTVKPWFAGKLDFSPEVKDLSAEGFPLAGGRVEYIAGHRVAALVYQRRQHIIDLFTWPEASEQSPLKISRNGYNALHWNSGGMTYWAVSDVSMDELETLRELYGR
jgi:anti-sigma factor RsiW